MMKLRLPKVSKFKSAFIAKSALAIILSAVAAFAAINFHVIESTKDDMLKDFVHIPEVDAVIVLGCLVRPGGDVSLSLRDRLDTALELYSASPDIKFIVSGDHGRNDYDEVNAMRDYMVSHGVPKDNVFMDHAGFSTYETAYRAKAIFGVKSAIFVSQSYHLPRTVYIAKSMGMDSYGANSDKRVYSTILQSRFRESMARVKDFGTALIFKPKPTFLGDMIPISKSKGRDTEDRPN